MAKQFRDNPEAQAAVAALPFVKFVEGNNVYFKPITMANYTVRGIYVSLYDGDISQKWEEMDNAPHPHVLGDGSLCASTSDVRWAISLEDWVGAVYAALCIAATHTYSDATQYVPEAVTCELCGEAGGYHDDSRITYFYHRGQSRYCHHKCYDELYEKLKDKGGDDDGIPF